MMKTRIVRNPKLWMAVLGVCTAGNIACLAAALWRKHHRKG